MRRAFVLLPSVLVAIAIACTSESDDYYDGPQSPCSTGPLYTYETQFPKTDEKLPRGPQCIPHCGQVNEGVGTTVAALPSGACEYDDEVCTMGAGRLRICPSGQTSRCNFSGWVCRCESKNWRCYNVSPGASICNCPDAAAGPDGGNRDASPDGPLDAAID